MDRLKLNTKNEKLLISNRFSKISDTEYIYRFPVYKYKFTPLITCVLTVNTEEMLIDIEIVDTNRGTLYFPYYNNEYGKNKLVDQINKRVTEYLKILQQKGIVKITEQRRLKERI